MIVWEKICCALSDQTSFEVFSPIWSHVNENEKKCQKSNIWNFASLYTTLADTLSRSMHEFLGVNLLCTFRGDVWNFFSHLVHVKENKKRKKKRKKKRNRTKIKNASFRKTKKNDLEIWWKGAFSPNLALICLTGSEKTGFTDGRRTDGRTTDNCLTTGALRPVAPSRAKNERKMGWTRTYLRPSRNWTTFKIWFLSHYC